MVGFGSLPSYFHYHENKEQEGEQDWEGDQGMEFHEESRLDWIRVLMLIGEIPSYL